MRNKSQPKPPLNLRIKLPLILAWALLTVSVAVAAFASGYGLAWAKVSGVYAETAILKAKAVELESEIQHLKNYAALIDALAAQGQAANALQRLPSSIPPAADTTPQGGDK